MRTITFATNRKPVMPGGTFIPQINARAGKTAPVPKRIPMPVRWLLLLYVATLPFEATDIGFMSGSLSLPKLFGFLFFASYVLYYGPLSGKRSFPRLSGAMLCFLGYAAVFLLNYLFLSDDYKGEFVTRTFTLVQLFLLFWITSDLLKNEKTAKSLLLVYAVATVFLALANLLHLPGFYAEFEPGRVTGLGDNPNAIAGNMGIAAVILMGLCLNGSYKHLSVKFLFLLMTLPLLAVMISTGSRGSVLAFALGCLVYLMPYHKSRMLRSALLGVLILGATVYKVGTSSEFVERWRESYYEGNLAGRETIFAEAVGMIKEKPLLGWHPVYWMVELGHRVKWPRPRDAHNLFLALLLEVGIVGAIPFVIGLWYCGRSAWKARIGKLGLLPMALMVAVVISALSSTTLISKAQWLILALSCAAPAIPSDPRPSPSQRIRGVKALG